MVKLVCMDGATWNMKNNAQGAINQVKYSFTGRLKNISSPFVTPRPKYQLAKSK